MKTTTLSLIAASFLAAPLSAQQSEPGTDLIDLFEKTQREGIGEIELRQMLEEKSRSDLQLPYPEGFRPLAAPESLPRWRIGLMAEPLEDALRTHFDLPEGSGLRVSSVVRGGPAAEAGLKENDIVVSANERKVGTLEELKDVVVKAGQDDQPVRLEVIHRGERKTVAVKPRGPEPEKRQEAREGELAKEKQMMMMAPAMERRMMQMMRRLDQQQQEIAKLRKQVEKLSGEKLDEPEDQKPEEPQDAKPDEEEHEKHH